LLQEIIWKAVREFWLKLVTDFEQLELFKGFQDKISSFEQRVRLLGDTCTRLSLQVENERDRVQQYMNKLDDKTLEIEKLTMALRDADDEKERERERQQVLIARLRASVCSTISASGAVPFVSR
jgi:chromosome segregation ATPase